MSESQEDIAAVLARPLVTEAGDDPSLVHVWWGCRTWASVYVDGEWVEEGWGEAWIFVKRGLGCEVEVRVGSQAGFAKPQAAVVRDEALAVDAHVMVSVDGAAVDEGAMWPGDESRGGFGALFGVGSFGLDDAAGPGLGEGELGAGPLGSDGTALRWRRADLPAGEHTIALRVTDARGLDIAEPVTLPVVMIERPPTPASRWSITPQFTLAWIDESDE